MPLAAAMEAPTIHWRAPELAPRVPLAKLLPLMRAAVAAAPERADLKLHLTKALFDTDRMAEIVDRLRPAVADDDADPELLYYLGRAALATRDRHLAAASLRSAAASGFGDAFTYLAETLLGLERVDEAVEAGLKGLERASSDFKSLAVLADALLLRGEAERLWALCVDLRARGAWGGYLPAVMAFAAAVLGRDDEIAALVDRDRWFSATQLAMPGDFNQRLAAELLAHKSPYSVHSTKAMRGTGTWIARLELAGGPLAQELLARVRAAAEIYVAERQAFADHPVIAHRPECVDLVSWALEVHHDGYQKPHIHPTGWISGVYYVEVPNVAPNHGECPGAVEFGLLSFGPERGNLHGPQWRVMPRPGLLLLFPSYYAHRTRPTGVGDVRISVAFDVTPSRGDVRTLQQSRASR
jgi:tetratricopeptide (TPR) repeat protein